MVLVAVPRLLGCLRIFPAGVDPVVDLAGTKIERRSYSAGLEVVGVGGQ